MATDWTTGKSGSFDLGTAYDTSLTNWAVLRFEWVEEYSPSTSKHRITITPKGKCAWSAVTNTNVGKFLTGTVTINGSTVFSESNYNVGIAFYSTGTYYTFTDATDGYKTEKWVSPEFSGDSASVVLNLYMNNPASGYSQQHYSSTQTLTLTQLDLTDMSRTTVWIHNGTTWVQATPYVWDGGWKVATGFVQE